MKQCTLIKHIMSISRLSAPVAFLLVFYPAFFGLMLASNISLPPLSLLIIFVIGSLATRSAGCIINDIFDRNFDKHVARTKKRPLATGSISIETALITLIILLIISLIMLLTLNKNSIYIGFITFCLIILYPLMKRITYFPQIFLGLTFQIGVLIGYSAITNTLSFTAFILYFGCCFWTIGYDTIYGFADINDDKKIGIKSLAILLEHNHYKFWIAFCYANFLLLFLLAFYLESMVTMQLIVATILAGILLTYQIWKLDITKPANCINLFKNNGLVGAFLAIGLLI